MATLLGATSGVSFGLSAESGILVKDVSIKASSDKQEVKNATGDVALIAYSNYRNEISVSGTVAGTTGVAAAAIGTFLTLANSSYVGGVTTGHICISSVSMTKGNDKFVDISVEGTVYPNI